MTRNTNTRFFNTRFCLVKNLHTRVPISVKTLANCATTETHLFVVFQKAAKQHDNADNPDIIGRYDLRSREK
jgi:hypothetical protein